VTFQPQQLRPEPSGGSRAAATAGRSAELAFRAILATREEQLRRLLSSADTELLRLAQMVVDAEDVAHVENEAPPQGGRPVRRAADLAAGGSSSSS